MEDNNDKLDMDVFGDAPILDLTEGAEPLFPEENLEDVVEQEENLENTDDNPIDTTDENLGSDEVVGDEDEVEGIDDTASADESSPNLFSSLTALLVDKGLISSADSTPEDEESFVNLFKQEIEKNEYSDLSDTQKQYLENLRKGIPEEEVKQHIKNVDQLEGITEETIKSNAELRQRIIYNDYLNKGFSEERALKNLRRSIELEADIEDATEALESLKIHNQSTFQQRAAQIEQEKNQKLAAETARVEKLRNQIKSTKEIIKDFPLTENIREQLEKTMFDVVGNGPDGNGENAPMKYARENKEDFDLKLGYLFTITKGFQDFSIIEKSKNTKVVKDLEKAMRSSRIKDNGTPTYMQDPDSYSIEISGHDLVID